LIIEEGENAMGIAKEIDIFFDNLLKEHGGNKAKAANALGVNPVTFWNWYEGNRGKKQTAPLFAALDRMGVTLNFEKQSRITIRRMGQNAPTELVKGETIPINVYAVAGAGSVKDITTCEPLWTIMIPPVYASRAAFALMVDGESMYPTIKNGAIVGISDDCELRQNEIYAVRVPYEHGFAIKRVSIDYRTQEYELRSDNPDQTKYLPVRIPFEESREEIIAGRVIWVWQMV
jgi:phage repressor protein C with HTH and peptisase S24 domain